LDYKVIGVSIAVAGAGGAFFPAEELTV